MLEKVAPSLFSSITENKTSYYGNERTSSRVHKAYEQAIFSADSQVDNFSEPIANAMNVMLGEIDPNQDLLLDCGNAEETSDNS